MTSSSMNVWFLNEMKSNYAIHSNWHETRTKDKKWDEKKMIGKQKFKCKTKWRDKKMLFIWEKLKNNKKVWTGTKSFFPSFFLAVFEDFCICICMCVCVCVCVCVCKCVCVCVCKCVCVCEYVWEVVWLFWRKRALFSRSAQNEFNIFKRWKNVEKKFGGLYGKVEFINIESDKKMSIFPIFTISLFIQKCCVQFFCT
jgi:hypothetical protein